MLHDFIISLLPYFISSPRFIRFTPLYELLMLPLSLSSERCRHMFMPLADI